VISANAERQTRILSPARKGRRPFRTFTGYINGHYRTLMCDTLKNRYLLTFIDHFTKCVKAFLNLKVSAETCARVYATQIIARHGSGSTLIMDQGRSFTSAFFQETCKILRVRKVRTLAYHAMSNWIVERLNRVLHDYSTLHRLHRYELGCRVAIFFYGLQSNTIQYDWVQSILPTTWFRDGFTKQWNLKAKM
jgi:transposase InsO family protein